MSRKPTWVYVVTEARPTEERLVVGVFATHDAAHAAAAPIRESGSDVTVEPFELGA